MKIRFALLAALALAACGDDPPRKYYSRQAFFPDDVAKSMGPGANSVSGSAQFKPSPNETRPCIDVPVRLVPDSPYARLRFRELYGSDVSGAVSGPGFSMYFGPEKYDYKWLESAKTANCVGEGSFSFEGVADGTWYVVANWVDLADKGSRGITMFKRVELRGGQAVTVNLP